MKRRHKEKVLRDFYNFTMDKGTGMIREDDINAFLEDQYPPVTNLFKGQKVTYMPTFGVTEHGIVKAVSDVDHTFVVFNCAGDWENFENYTAQRTANDDLIDGWVDKDE